ncbi:MAG: ribonuclease R [Clostridia bacterium]|nr:ribonuclease R [Clostridia bacterium]
MARKINKTQKNKRFLESSKNYKAPNNPYVGIFKKHSKGFGFVEKENGETICFVSKRDTKGAMNNDLVEIDLIPKKYWSKDSPEGYVTKILERNITQVVGVLERHQSFGFVVPEDIDVKDDIFISKANLGKYKNDDYVLVEITKYPDAFNNAEGVIVELVAKAKDSSGKIKALIKSKGLSEEFPSEVLKQAKRVVKQKAMENEDLSDRIDLRDKNIITIDGPDSKDLDDGVSVEILENGNYLLGVHIADVSHYVDAGTEMDKEALKRGNSVYLVDRVIPMLPKELSNGICSLNPKEDRLCLSCDMEINKDGEIVNHNIYKSIICSKERMVYDDVSDILENCGNSDSLKLRYIDILDDIYAMGQLAEILEQKRFREGSIDFDFPEGKIIVDKNGQVLDVKLDLRRSANKLIEEFMLAANKTVAEHFYWMNAPFVYRVHEKPEMEKIEELKAFLKTFGINLKGKSDDIYSKSLCKVLEDVKGTPFEHVTSTIMLRSMQKAYYSPDCLGHFGLGFKYYCHFTSPIRRYPDLIIHRIIKLMISDKATDKFLAKMEKRVEVASEISSQTELLAQKLERQVDDIKKAEYILNHIDEEYQGIISGVTNFGIFVELSNTVEGLVRLETIEGDFYIYEEGKYRIRGLNTNACYSMGDSVKIRVAGANPDLGQIDFELISD